ncbi:E3 ubiquitin-protein ligase MARCHF3-like isoform X1 [Ornithodoros turicata]|uniref:E3 ubiquitin-protein ligase MARCHF3-like isoform X1 n=1 Tax=Ornithodoros turicata TaxID=34597 RepID=UPI0031390EE2
MDVNDQDASICRICFRGTSAGYLLQPCSCRGSIGFSHRPCIEQWVKDRKEEVCNICRHRYPIEKKMKSMKDLLNDPNGRVEPLVYLAVGTIFALSMLHVFSMAVALTLKFWTTFTWKLKLINVIALACGYCMWAVFPNVAFKRALESSTRWRQENADIVLRLP